MSKDTKGAFGGVGAHPHKIDWNKASEVRQAFEAEEKRKHQQKLAKRKAAREAAKKQGP